MIRYNLNMQVPAALKPVNYTDTLIFAGSCFSEHIANKLKALNINVHALPNGIVFNPLSVLEPFKRLLAGKEFAEDDLEFHDGYWHGIYHHGVFSETSVSDALHKMNHALHQLRRDLEEASHLFLTFGTAYAYFRKSDNRVVANCHKIPQTEFHKHLLDLPIMFNECQSILQQLQAKYPKLHVVLTVSPVKHLRDGVSENLLSKSLLIQLCHQLRNTMSGVDYFPAYEIVNEDLRDYRFFESDGAHPNAMAIDCVFEKFTGSSCNIVTQDYIRDLTAFNKLCAHKIQKAGGQEYIKLMSAIEQKRAQLSALYQIDL
ncbi:MAG: GSCFA domain-containing protein [Chitinophagaceae bacterium]